MHPKGIPVVKGHAYGNDFALMAESDVQGRDHAALARAVCSRHSGIGADGLMIYRFLPASVHMRLFNADGSESEVSGNGIRCLAALAVVRPLGPIYLAGVAGVAALLAYEQSLVSATDLSQVKRAFDLNGYVGILYLLVTAAALLHAAPSPPFAFST